MSKAEVLPEPTVQMGSGRVC